MVTIAIIGRLISISCLFASSGTIHRVIYVPIRLLY